ncbi:MAG: CBS domain-containing protein [Kiritimatiellia bacterium]
MTIAQLKQMMGEKGVSGFPVVNSEILQGMVTRRDIWYLEDDRVKVSDVMTPAS